MECNRRPRSTAKLSVVDIDLTDEEALRCQDAVAADPVGSRARLAALNLQAPGATAEPSVETDSVLDLAVFRATGDRRLAALFGRAA